MKGYRFIDPNWEPIRRVLVVIGFIGGVFLGVILIRLLIFGPFFTLSFDNWPLSANSSNAENAAEEANNTEEKHNESITQPDEMSQIEAPAKPSGLTSHVITHVRDGDTIEVDNDKSGIRLIGVNTPETVNPNKDVECFGPEASSAMKELLGQTVELELDASQGERDSYDRLLAYVWLGQANVNYMLIYEGYGYEYTYSSPYKYQEQFKRAEEDARTRQAGLWSACLDII